MHQNPRGSEPNIDLNNNLPKKLFKCKTHVSLKRPWEVSFGTCIERNMHVWKNGNKSQCELHTKTDRHNSTESGSPESHFNRNYEKSAVRFWRTNCSQGETALCCAVLALSGTDTMVSLIPRLVTGHQRLDDRRSPLGASQQTLPIKKSLTFISIGVSPQRLARPLSPPVRLAQLQRRSTSLEVELHSSLFLISSTTTESTRQSPDPSGS